MFFLYKPVARTRSIRFSHTRFVQVVLSTIYNDVHGITLTTSSKSCSPSGASTANIVFSNTASCTLLIAAVSSVALATSTTRLAQSADSSCSQSKRRQTNRTEELEIERETNISSIDIYYNIWRTRSWSSWVPSGASTAYALFQRWLVAYRATAACATGARAIMGTARREAVRSTVSMVYVLDGIVCCRVVSYLSSDCKGVEWRLILLL